VCVFMCMCVCVRVYVCVCMCVCVFFPEKVEPIPRFAQNVEMEHYAIGGHSDA